MTLTPKEYLKVISLFLPYLLNVTLQQDISSKKVCIKTPKIDLEVSPNIQFATFWSTPCVISIKELIYVIFFLLVPVCVLEQICMILKFMYSTIFVSSKCVPLNNYFCFSGYPYRAFVFTVAFYSDFFLVHIFYAL
jgi:hypothetical protein